MLRKIYLVREESKTRDWFQNKNVISRYLRISRTVLFLLYPLNNLLCNVYAGLPVRKQMVSVFYRN